MPIKSARGHRFRFGHDGMMRSIRGAMELQAASSRDKPALAACRYCALKVKANSRCARPHPPRRLRRPAAAAPKQNEKGARANVAASGAVLFSFFILFCRVARRWRDCWASQGPSPPRATHTTRPRRAAAWFPSLWPAARYSGARAALRRTSRRPAAPAPHCVDHFTFQQPSNRATAAPPDKTK